MRPESKQNLSAILLVLSALAMAFSLVFGVVLILSPSGGFFPNLGKVLGGLLIATGNLASWLLNLIAWRLTRQRWLGIVTAVQTLPALILIIGIAVFAVNEGLDARASNQRAAVHQALKTDDLSAWEHARAGCGKRCRETLTPALELRQAAHSGAHQIARQLLDQGARLDVSDGSYYDSHISMHTCEGSYLPMLNLLEVAIARQDPQMLDILWPVSDAHARSEALWTAARLDRLDIVQQLSQAGIPLIRERPGSQRETLLSPAAAGAAVNVGRWLLETRPVPLSPDDAQAAWVEINAFMNEVHTPRSSDFAQRLIELGADINAANRYDETPLQEAVRIGSRPLIAQLLDIGADPAQLSEKERQAMNAVLAEPERPHYNRDRAGCVAP